MKPPPRRPSRPNRKRLNTASLFDPPYSESGYPPAKEAESSRREPLVVPRRWVNAVIGVFLLPLAWVGTLSFFSIFSAQTVHHHFWASEEFWFFSLGAVLWMIAFFGLPRPYVVYVFGHELTHAVWAWLFGGRVSEFKVGRRQGYIMTNKHNLWVALAPYFYPIYSVAVVILYGIAALFWDVAPHTRWLFLALGVTWTFHISFTLLVIPKGQSDLTEHGTFFSLVIIYLMNLLLLSALVILTAPGATLAGFGRELLVNTSQLAESVVNGLRMLK